MKNLYVLCASLSLLLVPACASDDGSGGEPTSGATSGSGSTSVTTGSGAGGGMGSGNTTGAGAGGMAPVDDLVLLIPNSDDDSIGIYDADDGSFIGNFLEPNMDTDAWAFSTPINAVQGPSGNIFVSDQVADAVLEFDPSGAYVGIFADDGDGLDNIRGIDFLGTDLLVSNSEGEAIARFDEAGMAASDFVASSDFDPYDIFVAANGDVLVSQIAPVDEVQLYPMGNTTAVTQLMTASFPQQIAVTPEGNYLVASFSDDTITEVTPAGQTVRTAEVESARGVYVLGNGHWLVTGGGGTGIVEIDPATGATVNTIADGPGFRFIEPATLP